MRLLLGAACLLALGAGAGWLLTAPETADAAVLEGITGDPEAGALAFAAGGCASCHAAEGATGEDKRLLGGGHKLKTPFGSFAVPNISPHETGIAGWTALDMVNAMQHGVSPEGAHYYPAFPYTSYARASVQEVADIHAYLMTLPAVDRPNEAHDLPFPFTVRRGLGLWKALHLDDAPIVAGLSGPAERGRHLAEGLAHCGECHTVRDVTGGLDHGRWLSGAPVPVGEGRVPNITPVALDWSEGQIVAYLSSGLTPAFDSAGGEMAEVVTNLALLPRADLEALAAYLKALPVRPSGS